MFGVRKDGKDGREAVCKECIQERKTAYRKTPKGLLVNIVKAQKSNSLKRGLPPVEYTSKDICDIYLNDDMYIKLFNDWKDSGFEYGKSPSIDRIDDYKGYTLDNIQLMTWRENNIKSHNDRKNGINNKQSTPVIGTRISDGSVHYFNSMNIASRETGVSQGNIGMVCRGKRNKAGGYIWRYAD